MESKKAYAELFKGGGGNGEVSGELREPRSLQDRTTDISPAPLIQICSYWFCSSEKPD